MYSQRLPGAQPWTDWAERTLLCNLVWLQSPPCQIRQQKEKSKSGFRGSYHTSLDKFVSKSANQDACLKPLKTWHDRTATSPHPTPNCMKTPHWTTYHVSALQALSQFASHSLRFSVPLPSTSACSIWWDKGCFSWSDRWEFFASFCFL